MNDCDLTKIFSLDPFSTWSKGSDCNRGSREGEEKKKKVHLKAFKDVKQQ